MVSEEGVGGEVGVTGSVRAHVALKSKVRATVASKLGTTKMVMEREDVLVYRELY